MPVAAHFDGVDPVLRQHGRHPEAFLGHEAAHRRLGCGGRGRRGGAPVRRRGCALHARGIRRVRRVLEVAALVGAVQLHQKRIVLPYRAAAGVHHLGQETHPVLDGATVGVGAAVQAGAEELAEQVAMGGMQLDAVEPGRLRTPSGGSEGVAQKRQVFLARLHRHDARFGIRHGRRSQNALAGRVQPRGRAAVRHLQDDARTRLMHDVDQFAVLVHEAVVIDAHHARIGLLVRDDVGIAGQDGAHAPRRQVPVDFQQLRRHAPLVGRPALPRGRPDEAVLRPHRPKGDPVEQRARSRSRDRTCSRDHRARTRDRTCSRFRAYFRIFACFHSHACVHARVRFHFNSSTTRATDS